MMKCGVFKIVYIFFFILNIKKVMLIFLIYGVDCMVFFCNKFKCFFIVIVFKKEVKVD